MLERSCDQLCKFQGLQDLRGLERGGRVAGYNPVKDDRSDFTRGSILRERVLTGKGMRKGRGVRCCHAFMLVKRLIIDCQTASVSAAYARHCAIYWMD